MLAEPLPHAPAGPEAGPRDRAARRDGRCPLHQPDRHPHPRHPAGISPAALEEAETRPRNAAWPAHRPARPAAGHHRRRGRARLRRCGLTPNRTASGFRLIVAIADVAALRPPRIAARPRGAHARQQRLFPRPRRADAARGAVERLVQPAPGRGPRLPVRRTRTSTRTAARPPIASAAA